jgi:XTP/dITP diphosphohydrolase
MDLTQILVATRNKDKVSEIQNSLSDFGVHIVSALDFPDIPEVVEDQDTLEGNAIKKAKTLYAATGIPTVADDTGLEVNFLNGAPGVYSSRFAGENVSYDDNINKLLSALNGIPTKERNATFRTVTAFCLKNNITTFEGICNGTILAERRGHSGFGYDPIFYVPLLKKTFAEMDLDEKNKISHRGIAFQKFKAFLKDN